MLPGRRLSVDLTGVEGSIPAKMRKCKKTLMQKLTFNAYPSQVRLNYKIKLNRTKSGATYMAQTLKGVNKFYMRHPRIPLSPLLKNPPQNKFQPTPLVRCTSESCPQTSSGC